ncbi:MAG TPA: Crp/Fnr family transcriptional regulator [Usitatibacter sp.]|nr:Crp/Fnr family transcriptional regulator [Usitatibacter sp.]
MLAGCEKVELSFPQIIAEPGEAIPNIYFPTGSFISLIKPMGGKNTLEVALAGNEAVYGVPVALGVEISAVHAIVQGSGPAWRMGSAAFRRELERVPTLRNCVDRYIHVLMSQLIQTAGCNRFHVVEQRVARWLLMTADRAHSSSFFITHEFLAYMLGVRRVGITEAASALQRRKLIRYTRGVVTIRDRRGLERASCSCYGSDLSTYEAALGIPAETASSDTPKRRASA